MAPGEQSSVPFATVSCTLPYGAVARGSASVKATGPLPVGVQVVGTPGLTVCVPSVVFEAAIVTDAPVFAVSVSSATPGRVYGVPTMYSGGATVIESSPRAG